MTRFGLDRNLVYRTTKTIALAEAKKRLSELVGRVAYGGEQFIITKRGRAAADFTSIHGVRVEDWMETRGP